MASLFSQIVSFAKTEWTDIAKEVDALAATVEKTVVNNPAAKEMLAADVSAVKQGASDLIGLGGTMLGDAAPAIISGAEAAADAAFLKLVPMGSAALPFLNRLVDGIVEAGIAALKAWGLATKAKLATQVSAPPALQNSVLDLSIPKFPIGGSSNG
jgi:hypothetical protein